MFSTLLTEKLINSYPKAIVGGRVSEILYLSFTRDGLAPFLTFLTRYRFEIL